VDRITTQTLKILAEMKTHLGEMRIKIEKLEKKFLKHGIRRDKKYYLDNQKEILEKNKAHAKTPEAKELRRKWKRNWVKEPGVKKQLAKEATKRYKEYKKDPSFVQRTNKQKLALYHKKKNNPKYLKNLNKKKRENYAQNILNPAFVKRENKKALARYHKRREAIK